MAADDPDARRPAGDTVRAAINWFSTDRSPTRQTIEQPDGPIAPGRLLDSARFDIQVNHLLGGETAGQAQALVSAQAQWLIRWMPRDHHPPSLDSAQQAGRAWGILIASDIEGLPDQDVLADVAARTGITRRAANEIHSQALRTSAAYNRADLLVEYDHAPDEVLIRDWNQLAACGPELPEAASRAQDVLELLTARVTGADDHDWMDATVQQAAQVYASVIRAQPLLASVATVIPDPGHPDTAEEQARLVELVQQGPLSAAATAAARARAVQEWADGDAEAEPDRTRTVEAAAPGTRTLLRLNEALAKLAHGTGLSAFAAMDPQRVGQVVNAIGQLSTRMRTILGTAKSSPDTAGEHQDPQRPQHQQHPPTPGQSLGGNTPRATP
ncbi:hypothetical protein ABT272_30795 [Streptomyces sp900105245]|uniref:Uncharacterized protein n=1 Tax=Streptomyces sp. 900105245 TaxID=3154379 RepID=A0ABV1UEK8_9ACTN